MKKRFLILTLFLVNNIYGQDEDPTSLWIFRMDQDASESFLFNKFQGNNVGFPKSTGLFKKNDTIRYQSGQEFRTCEVTNNRLNGLYKIYYPNGQIYLLSAYLNNVLKDSSIIYSEKGGVESIIKYLSPTQEQQIYYDKNYKIKKIENIEIIPTTKVTFKSGYVHTNTEKSIATEYFNKEGQKITKDNYYKLYRNEAD